MCGRLLASVVRGCMQRLGGWMARASGRGRADSVPRDVQRKKRTHAVQEVDPSKKPEPKSFVFRRGRHGVGAPQNPARH